MRYEQAKTLPTNEFKRLFGVHHHTFEAMVDVMREQAQLKKKSGTPAKLSLEDQVLVSLQYWRGAGDAPPPGSIARTFTLPKIGEFQKQPSAV